MPSFYLLSCHLPSSTYGLLWRGANIAESLLCMRSRKHLLLGQISVLPTYYVFVSKAKYFHCQDYGQRLPMPCANSHTPSARVVDIGSSLEWIDSAHYLCYPVACACCNYPLKAFLPATAAMGDMSDLL